MLEFTPGKGNGTCIVFEKSAKAVEFPFFFYTAGYTINEPGFYTTRSGRKDYQLIQTVSGAAKLKTDSGECELRAGSVALIDCNEYHDYRTLGTEEWNNNYFHFNGSGIDAYAPHLLDKLRVFYPVDINAFNDAFHFLMKNTLRGDPASCARACSLITDLLGRLMEARYALAQVKGITSRAIEYIEQNYAQRLSLDELANTEHLSKYHFARMFKAYFGMSPYQFITQYRIRQAKHLLEKTNDCVNQIAADVGYASANQLISHFKQLTGTTPSAYRSATRVLRRYAKDDLLSE